MESECVVKDVRILWLRYARLSYLVPLSAVISCNGSIRFGGRLVVLIHFFINNSWMAFADLLPAPMALITVASPVTMSPPA